METRESKIDLPGFRFHPTEEELLDFYLRKVVQGKKIKFDIIPTLNIYLYSPWQLPGLAKIGEREWYFFVPRDRKSGNGGRPNRTTERGFWKATGSDRQIRNLAEPRRVMGVKKTLVFYMGRAPRGTKTDWVMNEYRLPDSINIPLKDTVLCKIYRKATSLKELEQRAALEEDMSTTPPLHGVVHHDNNSPSTSDHEWNPSSSSLPELDYTVDTCNMELQKEAEVTYKSVTIRPSAVAVTEVQVPSSGFELGLEWMQDPLFTQSSPWLDQWSPNATFVNF